MLVGWKFGGIKTNMDNFTAANNSIVSIVFVKILSLNAEFLSQAHQDCYLVMHYHMAVLVRNLSPCMCMCISYIAMCV